MAGARQRYVIDTCSLTQVRRVYPQDVFPGVWRKLDEIAASGLLLASELVRVELEAIDDEVLVWASQNHGVFVPLDEATQLKARSILTTYATLVDLKKRKSGADPFIVALARLGSHVVVTEEKPSGGPHRVKIPDVCRGLSIDCIPVLEMFRREGLRLG